MANLEVLFGSLDSRNTLPFLVGSQAVTALKYDLVQKALAVVYPSLMVSCVPFPLILDCWRLMNHISFYLFSRYFISDLSSSLD